MYTTKTLANGARIIYESIPYVRSVSVGVWVNIGSRDEITAENGASHFIEHMVFKGTDTRTASQLAAIMDRIGGQMNAFTTKEHTCFYGRVLDTHVEQLADLLCDMLLNSKFDDDDVANERNVIFEEIGMYEDTPDDLVTELLFGGCFKGSPLAMPVLGKRSTLTKMDGAFLKKYMQSHYRPDKIVVAMSGNVSEKDVSYFADRLSLLQPGASRKRRSAGYTQAFITKKKSTEQNHLCLAFPGISITDDRRFAVQLMNSILGGGMSSRLFQSVREEKGLCYSIYSFGSPYQDTGLFGIYTALSRDTEQSAISVIVDEIKKLTDNGVTEDELELVREQVKANMLMSLESTSARMNRIGQNSLYFDRLLSTDELVSAYDSVTAGDILTEARRTFDFENLSFSGVGRVDTGEEYREKLIKIINC